MKTPPADILQDEKEYRIVLEVPGASRDGLEVAAGPVAGTVLVKAALREERAGNAQPLRMERGQGKTQRYERVIPVAWDADVGKARPELREGILTVSIPRKTGEDRDKK